MSWWTVGICSFKDWWRASINARYLSAFELGFTLHHPLFDAIILTQGAQLIHFQPKGAEPFLWSAELSTFQKGKAFRGGIPLCWPWFGKAGTPSHGFARFSEWKLSSYIENDVEIKIVFELSDSPKTRALWPYAFCARLEMSLGSDVEISLHVNAEKESTAALHTYLSCNDIHQVHVTGLGSSYHDALHGGVLCEAEENPLHVNHAVDRVYTKPEAITLIEQNTRTLRLSHRNHSDVVVWNPWAEGERSFSDMKEGDYIKMLCIESARISKPLSCEDTLHVKIASL